MAKQNVTITNISKQLIQLQFRHPKGDFYLDERQVRLIPGSTTDPLPLDHFNSAQIENIKMKREIVINIIE